MNRSFRLCLTMGALVSFALAIAGHASAIEQRVKRCTCNPAFDYRQADPQDFVCVSTASRAEIAVENDVAAQNRISTSDNRCISGFVWRDAFDGDGVCVTPQARDRVHQENRQHQSRVAECLYALPPTKAGPGKEPPQPPAQ